MGFSIPKARYVDSNDKILILSEIYSLPGISLSQAVEEPATKHEVQALVLLRGPLLGHHWMSSCYLLHQGHWPADGRISELDRGLLLTPRLRCLRLGAPVLVSLLAYLFVFIYFVRGVLAPRDQVGELGRVGVVQLRNQAPCIPSHRSGCPPLSLAWPVA